MILLAEILQVLAYLIFVLITAVYIRLIHRTKKQRKLSRFEKSMEMIAMLGFWLLVISFAVLRFSK